MKKTHDYIKPYHRKIRYVDPMFADQQTVLLLMYRLASRDDFDAHYQSVAEPKDMNLFCRQQSGDLVGFMNESQFMDRYRMFDVGIVRVDGWINGKHVEVEIRPLTQTLTANCEEEVPDKVLLRLQEMVKEELAVIEKEKLLKEFDPILE